MVFEGNECRLQHIIKNRWKLNKYEEENVSALHHAAGEGQLELMKMIISGSSCEGKKHFTRISKICHHVKVTGKSGMKLF